MPVPALPDEYQTFVQEADFWAALRRGELTYLDEWDDPSAEQSQRIADDVGGFRARARELQLEAPLDARALLATLEATAELLELNRRILYQSVAVNPEIGLLGNLVPFLPRQPLMSADDGSRYLVKLERFPDFAAAMAERLASGVSAERTVLRRHAEATADSLAAISENPAPFLQQPAPSEGFNEWESALAERVHGPLVEGLVAYRDAIIEHSVLAGRADDEPGIMFWPDGEGLYEDLVRANTNQDVTPDDVHRIGLERIERLEDEYREIAGPIFGTTDIAEIFARLREGDHAYGDADAIIQDAEASLARAKAAAPLWFSRWPKADCVAVPISAGAVAFYSAPKRAGDPGLFFFNVSHPQSWTLPSLEFTTFHESIPGHHFQRALAEEDPDLHYIQQKLYISAFNEGWALYTERLSDEMGLYSSDLARLGMLHGDSLRAFRLVVDTGMHAKGWSRQQAIDYGVAHTPHDPRTVAAEIDRYIGWPGQALGYMMGRLEIDRIRADAEARLGDGFDMKGFHEAVLGAGTITPWNPG